jgi:glycosyltransferase involved in cell wall biosynthesis
MPIEQPNKILVLSWSVPPAAIASSVVQQNLARQFTRDEMVLVGAYYLGQSKQEWRKEWPAIVYGMLQPPSHWRGERWIRLLQWPLVFLTALWTAYWQNCRVIFVVYPDQLFLLAGYCLSCLTGQPLVVYFHNIYLENSSAYQFAQWLEPRICARARHVFLISGALERLYRQRYPKLNCSTLVHSHNVALPDLAALTLPSLHHPIRLGFAGSINGSCAEAATRMLQLVQSDPNLALHICSGMSAKNLRSLGYVGVNIHIVNVPYDQLLSKLGESDILVHPHGFMGPLAPDEYHTIFPTKTIEFLLSQRPILAHMPAGSFIADFYQRNQCALVVCEPSLASLTAALKELIENEKLRQKLVRNALLAARAFFAPIVAKRLRDTVSKLCG